MIRWAILSDIHGNLEALDACLEDAERHKVDKIAVLGDTIDYGPDPRACLERVSAHAEVLLVGNHEEEAVEATGEAEESAIEWSVSQLQECDVWVRLVERMKRDGFAASASKLDAGAGIHWTHASAAKPTQQYVWPAHECQYLVYNDQVDLRLKEFLDEFKAIHGFNGHTHVPAVLTDYEHHEIFDPYEKDGTFERNHMHTFLGPTAIFFVPQGECLVRGIAGRRVAVNVGSVGQQRRLADPRASYVVYDGDEVRFRRIEYDWRKTLSKLGGVQVSDEVRARLAARLERGI